METIRAKDGVWRSHYCMLELLIGAQPYPHYHSVLTVMLSQLPAELGTPREIWFDHIIIMRTACLFNARVLKRCR